jgi:hypothetical protein
MVFYLAASFILIGPAARAGDLYTNGDVNGNYNNWFIDTDSSASVADSFTLGSASNLTAVDFVVWVNQGDTPEAVDWAITNSATPFQGTVASGTAAPLNNPVFIDNNQYGYDVYDVSFSLGDLSLAAGNYFLQLQNGLTAEIEASDFGDDPFLGWDENDGPSSAFTATVSGSSYGVPQSLINQTCQLFETCDSLNPQSGSETFEIEGTTPEPGTVTMLLSGLLLLAATALYKKRNASQLLPQTARIQPRN